MGRARWSGPSRQQNSTTPGDTAWAMSEQNVEASHQSHHHGHSHGLVDASIKRSRRGIQAVLISLAILGLTAVAQVVIFAATNSIALLADLIHNGGDALTAIPIGVAFAMGSDRRRRTRTRVVAAIFVSACVAGVEAVRRLIIRSSPITSLRLRSQGRSASRGTGSRASSDDERGELFKALHWSRTATTLAPMPMSRWR